MQIDLYDAMVYGVEIHRYQQISTIFRLTIMRIISDALH
jgi:hypothetical protein